MKISYLERNYIFLCILHYLFSTKWTYIIISNRPIMHMPSIVEFYI